MRARGWERGTLLLRCNNREIRSGNWGDGGTTIVGEGGDDDLLLWESESEESPAVFGKGSGGEWTGVVGVEGGLLDVDVDVDVDVSKWFNDAAESVKDDEESLDCESIAVLLFEIPLLIPLLALLFSAMRLVDEVWGVATARRGLDLWDGERARAAGEGGDSDREWANAPGMLGSFLGSEGREDARMVNVGDGGMATAGWSDEDEDDEEEEDEEPK